MTSNTSKQATEERDDTWAEVDAQGRWASTYEEGSHAAIEHGRNNPYKEGSYSHDEWQRGYLTMSKRESRGDDV